MKKFLVTACLAVASTSVVAEIDPIVIIGNGYSTPLKNTVQSIRVITADDIKASGASSVAQALSTIAGITYYDSQGNGSSPSIAVRGFGNDSAQNMKITVDGVATDFATKEGGQLSHFDLSQIAQIEILYGSGGVLYGDGATAGVINIVTQQGDRDFQQVSLKAGSFGYGELGVSGQTDGLSYSMSQSTRDGFREHTEVDMQRVNLSLALDGEKVSSVTRVHGQRQDRATQGTASAAAIEQNRRSGGAKDLYEFERFGVIQTFDLHHRSGLTQLTLAHQTSDQLVTGPSANDYNTEKHDIRLSHRIEQGSASITLGVEKVENDLSSAWTNGSDSTTAGFSRATWFNGDTTWVIGGRGEKTTRDQSVQRRFNNTAFEVGVSRVISSSLTLKGRLDSNFRLPTLDESPESLKPQTGHSAELSAVYVSEGASVDLSLFRIRNTDEISYRYNSGFGGYFESFNLDRSVRRGMAVNSQFKLSPGVKLMAGAELLDAKYSDGGNVDKRIPMVPEVTGTLGVSLGASWVIQGRYESSKPIFDDYLNLSPKLPSNTQIDVTHTTAIAENTTLVLRTNNLFDRETYAYGVRSGSAEYYIPNEGRTFEVGLTHRF